jgi:hypothetical protein
MFFAFLAKIPLNYPHIFEANNSKRVMLCLTIVLSPPFDISIKLGLLIKRLFFYWNTS